MAQALAGLVVPAVDGLAYGLLLFVAAAGLTLAYGVGGVLNLAHGTLYALGAYLAAVIGDGTWTALTLALTAGTLAGAGGGGLLAALTAPLAGRRDELTEALLTSGVALVGGAAMVSVFGADNLPVTVPTALERTTTIMGHPYPAYRLAFIVVACLLAASGYLLIRGTRAGAVVRAAVDDREALALLGVNPVAVRAGVLTGAGVLGSAAGVLGAPILGPGPGTAATILMPSLVIVVLGRLGSIPGGLLASVAVGEVHALGVSLVPAGAPFLLFAAMAVVLALRAPQRTRRRG